MEGRSECDLEHESFSHGWLLMMETGCDDYHQLKFFLRRNRTEVGRTLRKSDALVPFVITAIISLSKVPSLSNEMRSRE